MTILLKTLLFRLSSCHQHPPPPGRMNSIQQLFIHSCTNLILNKNPFAPATVLDAELTKDLRVKLTNNYDSM